MKQNRRAVKIGCFGEEVLHRRLFRNLIGVGEFLTIAEDLEWVIEGHFGERNYLQYREIWCPVVAIEQRKSKQEVNGQQMTRIVNGIQ